MTRAAALALGAALAAPAVAADFALALGAQASTLREDAPAGAVRERGALPLLRLRAAQAPGDGWGWRAAVEGTLGSVHYDGHTQAGVPLQSRTGLRGLTLEAAALRRAPGLAALAVELGAQLERYDRRIRGRDGVAGLDERLLQGRLRAGLAGATPWGGWRAGVLWGERGPLRVRFDDALYDPVTVRSGRARGWDAQAWCALGGPWQALLRADALRMDRGVEAALTRDGVGAGRVHQPAWRRERLTLALERAL